MAQALLPVLDAGMHQVRAQGMSACATQRLQNLYFQAGDFTEAALVASGDRIVLGDGCGADHEVALAHGSATLGEPCPERGMDPGHGEVESDHGKLGQQAFNEGLAPVALLRRPCPVDSVQKFRFIYLPSLVKPSNELVRKLAGLKAGTQPTRKVEEKARGDGSPFHRRKSHVTITTLGQV